MLRVGAVGSERCCVELDDGRVLEVGNAVGDFDVSFFEREGINELRSVDAGSDGRVRQVESGTQRIGPPITRPGEIICIGLNYRDHARESGRGLPSKPVVFVKWHIGFQRGVMVASRSQLGFPA